MEIGSEFWSLDEYQHCNNEDYWYFGKDTRFTLSGRTSIHYVLMNILKERLIKNVYFPSYSCKSMEKPFYNLGIDIEYYSVYYDNGLKYDIDVNKKCDIFFAMNYFGFESTNMECYIKEFKKRNVIIIEDITHSLLSDKMYSTYSDFLIGSLRKWFPIICGGIAISLNTKFSIELLNKTNEKMVYLKKIAMNNKRDYIMGKSNKKEMFLKQFEASNMMLENDYELLDIDNYSYNTVMKIDLNEIKKIRKNNFIFFYNCLKKIKNVSLLVDNINDGDCLLYIPIIVDIKKRDYLRKKMIEKNIYLPVHWPDNIHSNISKSELSIICDQRYNKQEIIRIVEILERIIV